jgi:SAM-dependent methyltransferase
VIDAQVSPWDAGGAAYDQLAGRYDLVPIENRINRLMRSVSLSRLKAAFEPGARVLEIGCGTGDEALALASAGVSVVAVDASQEMVRVARSKAEERGLEDRVEFHRARARDLPHLADSLGGPFDGGYASFSLAYEPDLRPVATGLHELLNPQARFLASVPSRFCLVEFLLAVGSGHPSFAGRRLGDWHGHKVGAQFVPIRTYTPHSFVMAMEPYFTLERMEALPAIVPPPYMNRVYARFDGLADALERVDERLRARFPFRSVGDHFLAELRHVS